MTGTLVGCCPAPLVIELFCGGGGASVGFWLAGFDVIGVDHRPQEHYPFGFIEADVMALDLATVVATARAARGDSVIVVTGGPPCQRYSTATPSAFRDRHPDLVPEVRRRLSSLHEAGVIDAWVIENVPGAPMANPVRICGEAMGLGVRRHRLFDASHELAGVACAHGDVGVASVVGGYGGPARGRYVTASEGREAMGVPWLPWPSLTQSIPPPYTEHLGRQLAEVLRVPSAVEGRRIDHLRPRCACGVELAASVTGRWPRHCSQACRQRAYMARRRRASVRAGGIASASSRWEPSSALVDGEASPPPEVVDRHSSA